MKPLLLVLALIAVSACAPAPKEDQYAKEVADTIDSTLLQFKNGLMDFITDTSKVGDMFTQLSDSINKYAAKLDNGTAPATDSNMDDLLKSLAVRTNRSLHEISQ